MRSEDEPSAMNLLRLSRDRDGGLNGTGRAWQEDGTPSARYWSEAARERDRPASSTSGWASALGTQMPPQLEGTGEIMVETADRATGYWTTRSDRDPGRMPRTVGVYLRVDPVRRELIDPKDPAWTDEAASRRAFVIVRRAQDRQPSLDRVGHVLPTRVHVRHRRRRQRD
jgi:hypothetical protein